MTKKRQSDKKAAKEASERPATVAHVRLTPTEAAALDQLVADRKYRSWSDALRVGLLQVLKDNRIKQEALESIERERLFHVPRKRSGRYLEYCGRGRFLANANLR